MDFLSDEYWSARYQEGKTGWDIGSVSEPLKCYIDQLTNKEISILIPGSGNGYEAEYLYQKGFKQVYLLDFAQEPLSDFQRRNPSFPAENLLHQDIFTCRQQFDLILEQTMFCALNPALRQQYISHLGTCLTEHGKYVGLLFDREFEGGPPFGGSKAEYMTYLSTVFRNIQLNPCYNSIESRKGTELFCIASR